MPTTPENTRRQGAPRFSISQISTLPASFEDDLTAYAAAGLDGIGIWELKLPEDGDDAAALEAFARSGLEIFSDNGAFGSPYPDSLWDIPAAELAHSGQAALAKAWQGRQVLVPALTSPQRKEAL
jgi:sugar phosphate isomerase/epimerase